MNFWRAVRLSEKYCLFPRATDFESVGRVFESLRARFSGSGGGGMGLGKRFRIRTCRLTAAGRHHARTRRV
jgi:hypothetical protein